jgi:hypothetical protein
MTRCPRVGTIPRDAGRAPHHLAPSKAHSAADAGSARRGLLALCHRSGGRAPCPGHRHRRRGPSAGPRNDARRGRRHHHRGPHRRSADRPDNRKPCAARRGAGRKDRRDCRQPRAPGGRGGRARRSERHRAGDFDRHRAPRHAAFRNGAAARSQRWPHRPQRAVRAHEPKRHGDAEGAGGRGTRSVERFAHGRPPFRCLRVNAERRRPAPGRRRLRGCPHEPERWLDTERRINGFTLLLELRFRGDCAAGRSVHPGRTGHQAPPEGRRSLLPTDRLRGRSRAPWLALPGVATSRNPFRLTAGSSTTKEK